MDRPVACWDTLVAWLYVVFGVSRATSPATNFYFNFYKFCHSILYSFDEHKNKFFTIFPSEKNIIKWDAAMYTSQYPKSMCVAGMGNSFVILGRSFSIVLTSPVHCCFHAFNTVYVFVVNETEN